MNKWKAIIGLASTLSIGVGAFLLIGLAEATSPTSNFQYGSILVLLGLNFGGLALAMTKKLNWVDKLLFLASFSLTMSVTYDAGLVVDLFRVILAFQFVHLGYSIIQIARFRSSQIGNGLLHLLIFAQFVLLILNVHSYYTLLISLIIMAILTGTILTSVLQKHSD